jgi:8-oxo-dGTP pyrophosphatase MutT (NUDIX family)
MPQRNEIVTRRSSRAVLLTEANEILLLKLLNPGSQWRGWITPGGGRENGETGEQALVREIYEELGLRTSPDLAKPLWFRTHEFPWENKWIVQTEDFYLLRVVKFEPQPTVSLAESELMAFEGWRWWPLGELMETKEMISPPRLGTLVEKVLVGGPPTRPESIDDN